MRSEEVGELENEDLIEALCEIEEGLTEWEVEFVDSISKQNYELTTRQREIAERIFDEKY